MLNIIKYDMLLFDIDLDPNIFILRLYMDKIKINLHIQDEVPNLSGSQGLA